MDTELDKTFFDLVFNSITMSGIFNMVIKIWRTCCHNQLRYIFLDCFLSAIPSLKERNDPKRARDKIMNDVNPKFMTYTVEYSIY